MISKGLIDVFKHGELKMILGSCNVIKVQNADDIHSYEDVNFRYCTEAMAVSENNERELLRSRIDHLGDSLVVAGSPKKMRIHIHTNTPEKVFSKLSDCDNITF